MRRKHPPKQKKKRHNEKFKLKKARTEKRKKDYKKALKKCIKN